MDDIIVTLSLRWLQAVDAFSASCVSQEWAQALSAERDGGDLWKQVCQNSGPSEIPSLESSTDYRHLAFGLWQREKEPIAPPAQRYSPTTKPRDFYAVVDVYKRHESESGKRRKEVITSFVCPIEGTTFEKSNDECDAILEGANPYSASRRESNEVQFWRERTSITRLHDESTPYAYAARKVVSGCWPPRNCIHPDNWIPPPKALRVDVTLFRRDNAKSVCLLHGAPTSVDYPFNNINGRDTLYMDEEEIIFAATDTGRIAKSWMTDHCVKDVHVGGTITLMPSLPSPGSEDEPQWLANARQAVAERRTYEPNVEDMTALANIDHFGFGLKQFHLEFSMPMDAYTSDDENEYEFKSQDELIVALEGLCWK